MLKSVFACLTTLTPQSSSIETLLAGITETSSNPLMAEPTKAVCDKFHKVFELFGTCHRAYSGMVMDETAITQLGMGILGGYVLC